MMLRTPSRFLALTTALALSACGGGGGGDSGNLLMGCSPITGGGTSTQQSVSPGCAGCGVNAPASAIDGSGVSFANLQMPAGAAGTVTLRAVAQNGVVFPAGTLAGMVHSISYGTSSALAISVRTYAMGVQQESFNFNSGAGSSDMDPAQPGRVSFSTQTQFDAVELDFTRTGGTGEVNARVHAFCAN